MMTETVDAVIEVKNAYKKYSGEKYVLRGLNMSVPKGTIYSLLGPSGCGKTTLLSCIVGLRQLTSGFISMPSIKTPLDFSYMPQDVALESDCSIEETFHLYGLMFGMDKKDVVSRFQYLCSFLHLPHKNRLISSLSGGQQRRVSFAVALLTDATTLLLDEPTVGLDPLLTTEIWEYLQKTTKTDGRTVIITTHYIDEARRSDKIGFMREGRILKEGEPKQLMQNYNCTNLEDVFIALCRIQITDSTRFNDEEPPIKDKKLLKTTYNYQSEAFNFNRFKANVYKDYIWAKRNLILFLGMMSLPIHLSLLFCFIYGYYPDNLKIGLVTLEIPSSSVDNICTPQNHVLINNDPYLDMNNCTLPNSLSCEYYQILNERFDVLVYADQELAIADAKKNKIWAVIQVANNFTEATMARVNEGRDTDQQNIQNALLNTQIDMSNFIIAYYIQDQLVKVVEKVTKIAAKSCSIRDEVASLPYKVMEYFYNRKHRDGSGSEVAPYIVGLSFYLAIMYTCSALVENSGDTASRYKVIGVNFLEVVSGHLVIQFFMLIFQNASMLTIFFLPFDYELNGSLTLTLIGMTLVELVGISIGIFFSKIFTSPIPMNSSMLFLAVTIILTSGIVWPQEAVHWILKEISWMLPVQPVIPGVRNIITKDFGITHPTVYFGLFSCILWIILPIIFTLILCKVRPQN